MGLLLGFLSHLSRAYRWLFMLEPMGYKVRFGNSVMAVFATYLINYTIPRAGEVARATILTNYEKVPFEKGFGTIVAERIADLFMLFLVVILALINQFDVIYTFLIEKFNPLKLGLAFAALVIISFLGIKYIRKSNFPLMLKIKSFLNGLLEGLTSIFKMKKKWSFIFHTLFIWVMYVLMFYVTSFAIKETSNIPLAAILVGFVFGSFSIAAINGGIGLYPLAIYTAFAFYGIPKDPGYAFGWIMWAAQTLMIIVFGGLSLIYLPIYNRKATLKNL